MQGRWGCQTLAQRIYGHQEQFPCVCKLQWTRSLSPPFATLRLGTAPLPAWHMAYCSLTWSLTVTSKPRVPTGGTTAAVLPLAARPAACAQRSDSVLGVQMGRCSGRAEFPQPCSQLAGLGGGSASACRKGLSICFSLWILGLLFASAQPSSWTAAGRAGWAWAQVGEDLAPTALAQGGPPPTQRRGRRWLGSPAAISSASGQASSANERTGERVHVAGGSAVGDPLLRLAPSTAPHWRAPWLCAHRDQGPNLCPGWEVIGMSQAGAIGIELIKGMACTTAVP